MTKIKTPLAEKLGLDLPIFGFSHSPEVTAEITKSGGMGVYGIAHDPPDQVPAKLAYIRELLGDRPIAIDIMMPKGMPENETLESVRAVLPQGHVNFVDGLVDQFQVPPAETKTFFNSILRTPSYFEGQLQALLASDVEVVAFGVGLTPDAVSALKERGKTVGALIGNLHHFEAFRHLDLDFIVAQGTEAGGHTGTIGTMVIVPQIVQMAGDLPVLAAGGIGHGAQIAGALAMGAQGVWLGTAWLSTKEHSLGDHAISDKLRQKLFAAGSGDTAITKGSSGKPQRQIRSAWTEAWVAPNAPAPLKMPYQHALVGDLLTAIDEHQVEPMLHIPAGQGVAWTTGLKSVADVMADLRDQTLVGLRRAGAYALD
ncbi:MAG: nitronate monooxygenase [Alphaproteobacteria bacterium]|nr:nitronate monooxygenase [Alphaproteobacteria bacterium]